MPSGGFEWYVQPPPDLELWARWTAAGAVSGIMHEQGGGKGNGDKTHIFDTPEGLRIWRKFAKLRMQLFRYMYLQAVLSRSDLGGVVSNLTQYSGEVGLGNQTYLVSCIPYTHSYRI